MYMILFVLDDPGFLENVLSAWEELGIRGITVLLSTGLGRIRQKRGLMEDMPLFPSLQDLYTHREKLSRTLFTILDDDTLIDRLVETTERIVGKLDDPNTGILIVLPVTRVYGGQKVSKPLD